MATNVLKRLRLLPCSRWGGTFLGLLTGFLLLAAVLLNTTATAASQESESELAKKTQNPVADLISVPFQNNFN